MSGNQAGGKKAAEKNKRLYGEDFYKKIGSKGGSKTMAEGAKPKGFAANIQRASEAGRRGGLISRRKKRI